MNSIAPHAFAASPAPGGAAISLNPVPRAVPPPAARPPEANVWLRQLFDAKAAQTGGVVRRRLRDVEGIVGLAAFEKEVARRGFTAITDGSQVVVFCHAGGVRRLA